MSMHIYIRITYTCIQTSQYKYIYIEHQSPLVFVACVCVCMCLCECVISFGSGRLKNSLLFDWRENPTARKTYGSVHPKETPNKTQHNKTIKGKESHLLQPAWQISLACLAPSWCAFPAGRRDVQGGKVGGKEGRHKEMRSLFVMVVSTFVWGVNGFSWRCIDVHMYGQVATLNCRLFVLIFFPCRIRTSRYSKLHVFRKWNIWWIWI